MTVNTKRTEWDRENMRTVSCRLRREDAEKFKLYAQYMNTTPHALLAEYVHKCLALGENVTPEMRDATVQLRNENEVLRRKMKIAEEAVQQARERALRAEALVDKLLKCNDGL